MTCQSLLHAVPSSPIQQVASTATSRLLLAASCSSLLQAAPIKCLSTLHSNGSSSSSAAPGCSSSQPIFQASYYQQQQQLQHAPWQVPSIRQISSSTASSQQQQDPEQQQQRGATPTEETKNLSKAFLTSVLDAEELWLKGVAGQLKMWAATKKVPLEVRGCYVNTSLFVVMYKCTNAVNMSHGM
jgi:hypothetical protein